jgi:hypothetical protein
LTAFLALDPATLQTRFSVLCMASRMGLWGCPMSH